MRFLAAGATGLLLALCLLAAKGPAHAEVEKFMRMCEGKLCPSYRVKFTPPPGWEEDTAATREQQFQVFVPRGGSFHSSPAIIYIRVNYNHDKKTVAQFIDMVQGWWRERVPDTKITRIDAVERDNGKPPYQIYLFENASQPRQAFELVGYGEDGDKDGNAYILSIVMTAASKKAIDDAEAGFRAALKAN